MNTRLEPPAARTWPASAASNFASGSARASDPRRARFALAALVVADSLAIVGLHRLGTTGWASVEWFDRYTWSSGVPEVVVTAGLRVVALGLAYWVGLMVVVALATAQRNTPSGTRHWTTLPGIRRLVDRALAIGVATSTLLAPAVATATEQPPIPVIVEVSAGSYADQQSVPVQARSVREDPKPTAAEPATPMPRPGQPTPGSVATEAGSVSPELRRMTAHATMHAVRPGDSMWLVAERHLASNGASASDAEVAGYWVRLIDANRDSIRSGDPDLIYPGELLVLPEVGA